MAPRLTKGERRAIAIMGRTMAHRAICDALCVLCNVKHLAASLHTSLFRKMRILEHLKRTNFTETMNSLFEIVAELSSIIPKLYSEISVVIQKSVR